MSIASNLTSVTYRGDGSTTVFTIPFAFDSNDEVEALLRDAVGVETVLAQGADYTLSGAGSGSGGFCTLAAPAAGETATGANNAQTLVIRLLPCAASEHSLPRITRCDAGKAVVVNADRDGFTLANVGGGAESSVELEMYKAPVPVVVGAMTVTEGDAIALSITDHEDGDTYTFTQNPLGLSLEGIAISGTAPEVSLATAYELRLRRVRPDRGMLFSDACIIPMLVQPAAIENDPEILTWEDNATDWPEADRSDVSVGTDQMEPTGTVLRPMAVDSSSTVNSLVLTDEESGVIEARDWLLLDGDELLEVPEGMNEEMNQTLADGYIGGTINGTTSDTFSITTSPFGFAYSSIEIETGVHRLAVRSNGVPNHGGIGLFADVNATLDQSWADSTDSIGVYEYDSNGQLRIATLATLSSIEAPYGYEATGHGYLVTTSGHHVQGNYFTIEADLDNNKFRIYASDGTLVWTSDAMWSGDTVRAVLAASIQGSISYDTGGQREGIYTIPCSPALTSVPSSVRVLPELYMAAGENAADADEFVALEPVSATSGAGGTVVTCEPEVLPDDTRALSVGIAGDGWSAYAATKEQEADQGDWTQATVSMTLGDDFYKDATASMLMEG